MYKKEIQVIHDEFNGASDLLLEEAKEELEKLDLSGEQKANRLKSLGFGLSKDVEAHSQAAKAAKVHQESLEYIRHYAMKYPNNKFINQVQLDAICDKYNLMYSETSNYTGFVPEKNLAEIEAFKVQAEDVRSTTRDWRDSIFDGIDFEAFKRSVSDVSRSIETRGIRDHFEMGSYASPEIETVITTRGELPILKREPRITNFIIAAPAKDFVDGLEKHGNELKKKTPPDPVVFQPVKGGYLIVTAWGDEASDPLVVNQSMN